MLSFENAIQLEEFRNAQNNISNKSNYLDDVLLPALTKGNWSELEGLTVYQDSKKTILFKEDSWKFIGSDIQGKSVVNILFSIQNSLPVNTFRFNSNDEVLKNQIKCLTLVLMYFSRTKIGLGSIQSLTNILRITAKEALSRKVYSFNEITMEMLEYWVSDGYDISSPDVFKGVNALVANQGLLPFEINFTKLTHKSFNQRAAEVEQYCVIPPRLYFSILNDFSNNINTAYLNRNEILQAVKDMVEYEKGAIAKAIKGIRNSGNERSNKQMKVLKDKLKSVGTLLCDKEQSETWMDVYHKEKTALDLGNLVANFHVSIGGNDYRWGEFRAYLRDLSAQASYLCMALSGMRIDELYRMRPTFGAQKILFDKQGNISDNGKEVIYFLTTRQSKITLNSQTKDDIFVTTEVGWKSFHVIDLIHSSYRELFPKKESNRMFAGLKYTQHPRALSKAQLGTAVLSYCNKKYGRDLVLTEKDMSYLMTSDPSQSKFKIGAKFILQNHQLRRSLAYYLIGYELCSFPALKQQLGHFSMAMTRWYARNAVSLQKLYSEIQHERNVQQADVFVRIYKKLANGERIAGGKGKAKINEIAKQGEIYFEDGANKRLLSRDYWIDRLENGKEHIHAIAPGMYCTNNKCSMRISIDLTECVGCEFDYIENVVYAEASRMDAMRNLNLLLEYNELNSSSATKYHLHIKAAERIMVDLEFEFKPYAFQKEITDLLIATSNTTVD
jgi:integrase